MPVLRHCGVEVSFGHNLATGEKAKCESADSGGGNGGNTTLLYSKVDYFYEVHIADYMPYTVLRTRTLIPLWTLHT